MKIVDLPIISMVIIQLIIDILISLDWCKRKPTGNHILFAIKNRGFL